MAKRASIATDRVSRFIARAIGVFAPNTAMGYLGNRARLMRYTGASPDGPSKNWRPTTKSADAILSKDRKLLLARARDLERNSGHISGAVMKIANNVIYTGIRPQARMKDQDGRLKKNLNDFVERQWKNWAHAPEIDFYDLQELVLRHLWIDGECLVHRFYDRDLRARELCPLGLEVLEPDFIASEMNVRLENGNQIKAGIEFSKAGRPVAYHLFKEHPGESSFGGYFSETRRIPASEIKHIFHRRRASQTRGVSWLSAIIIEMRDFNEYQSNERIAARLMSAFGAFIESPYPEHQQANPLFSDNEDSTGDVPTYLEPGRIDTLPPGTNIKSVQYNRPGDTYEPFTKTSLKGASTGSGMSYENFSNDYEGATYSSARQAVLEERRGYRKLQAFLNRQLNEWVWQSWLDFASIAQLLGGIGNDVPVSWQNPGWPWIDPQKDAKGAQLELEMKTTSRTKIAADRGDDWLEEVEILGNEERILKENGLATEEGE